MGGLHEGQRFCQTGTGLGVVGVVPVLTSGHYSFIPGLSLQDKTPWIRTDDLFATLEEAARATPARFLPK